MEILNFKQTYAISGGTQFLLQTDKIQFENIPDSFVEGYYNEFATNLIGKDEWEIISEITSSYMKKNNLHLIPGDARPYIIDLEIINSP